jgi:phosphoribosylglycinamide formyltransferase 1
VNSPARIAVLASGGGSNLQSLIDRFNGAPSSVARVDLVIGSRAGIGALQRAESADVPGIVMDTAAMNPPAAADAMLAALNDHAIDLVVLAGYLKLIPQQVVARYHGRMINIHPALLPAFGGRGMYGLKLHEAVLRSGSRVTGATVHLVDDRYDEGKILAQWPVPVLPDDTPERLAERVLRVEHLLLPVAVEILLEQRRRSDESRAAETPGTNAGALNTPPPFGRGGPGHEPEDAQEEAFGLMGHRAPTRESVLKLNRGKL